MKLYYASVVFSCVCNVKEIATFLWINWVPEKPLNFDLWLSCNIANTRSFHAWRTEKSRIPNIKSIRLKSLFYDDFVAGLFDMLSYSFSSYFYFDITARKQGYNW